MANVPKAQNFPHEGYHLTSTFDQIKRNVRHRRRRNRGAIRDGTLKIISIAVNLIEKLHSNGIITALGKMHTALEIPTTQVQANRHILFMTLKTIVVQFDVRIEDFIGIDSFLLHSLEHACCTEVGEEGVVDLDISAAGFVEVGDFFAVGFGNVGEVAFFGGVGFFGEGVVAVAEVEPFRGGLKVSIL